MLPALAAALVGVITAGGATLISNFDGSGVSDGAQVALSAADADDPKGGLERPGNRMGTDSPNTSDQDSEKSEKSSEGSPESSDGTNQPSPSGSSDQTSSETTVPTTPDLPQSEIEDDVVALANAERAKVGCEPLRTDPMLAQAAQDHSGDMAQRDYFDHTTPEGLTFAERIVNAGYPTPGAENIARGQQDAADVMQSWMDSDGHRANIQNCDLKSIGVGLDENGMFWTQDFGY